MCHYAWGSAWVVPLRLFSKDWCEEKDNDRYNAVRPITVVGDCAPSSHSNISSSSSYTMSSNNTVARVQYSRMLPWLSFDVCVQLWRRMVGAQGGSYRGILQFHLAVASCRGACRCMNIHM